MDEDNVQELNQIQIDLQELMKVGLVDIIGINEEGEWLYGLTEEGRKVTQGLFDAN
jgi:predicted transcriptional regulator with HTH domain